MVKGLNKFREHFKGFEDCFILIGGAACDLWMGERGLVFRATKDLDLVLVLEALRPEFFIRFWDFVRKGKYKDFQQSEIRPEFYRFKEPTEDDYPYMIELFSRNALDLSEGVHLTPIPADEDISSLSAILLNDDYYNFVVESKNMVGEVPIVPAFCLIPLKARAFLDLVERKPSGEKNVDSRDIKKHRNDVFRLYLTLAPADRFDLPELLKSDLSRFCNSLPPRSQDWPAIREAVGSAELPQPTEVIDQLKIIFQLPD